MDIYNPERVIWAQAWRFNPEKGLMILPGMNMLPLDPRLGTDAPPVSVYKAGFDCTIPVAKGVDRFSYAAAEVSEPLDVGRNTEPMDEDEVSRG